MKKFSTRKIASLVLVFALFVSVIANIGALNVKAEGTATVTFNLMSEGAELYGVASTGYELSDGTWAGSNWQTSSDDYITIVNSNTSCSISWDTAEVNQVWCCITGKSGSTDWIQTSSAGYSGSATCNIWLGEDGTSFTTVDPSAGGEEPSTTTTATATVTYAGESDSYWFGSTSCANADKTAWPSYDWISSGSNDYITIAQDGAKWTVTWDTAKVSEVYVELGAGSNKVWPTLTDGTALTYYDGTDGLTTEEPAPTLPNSATITYEGDQSIYGQTWGYWDNTLNTWVRLSSTVTNGQSYTDDAGKLTMSLSGKVLTVSWASDVGPNVGIQVNSNVYFFPDSFSNGDAYTVYDAADGTLTQETPSGDSFTASATITYMGSQGGVWTGSGGVTLNDGNWTWNGFWVQGPGSNEYVSISHVGNVYTIKWDPTVSAGASFGFGVAGDDFTAELWPDIYDGAAYVVYDDVANSKLVTELPSNYASATIIYMGSHDDTWTCVYGLTPARTDINGWWMDDYCAPDSPVGAHSMCYANGNTYTYTWNADVVATCWALFGCNSYDSDAPHFGLKDGAVIKIYDKDVLGVLSTTAPKMVTSTVVVNSDESTWAGIAALCTADGNWTSGLWISDDNNDYGITVTTTTEDGKTIYTYTYDMTQVTTVCAEIGTVNSDGGNSRIWINLSGNTTRNVYVTEDTHEVTTFPAGYTYTKPGTGEGVDGSVTVHYVREDGDYSGWYFGYWYQVDGSWFSYNKTFGSDGTYVLDLNDIPADEIGFAINYNDWESKDYDDDRFFYVSKLVADDDGMYHVYIYSGDANVYYEPQA